MSNFYALRLYREILRKSKQLKLTDKEYFRRTVRKDFEKHRYLENKEEIDFQIKVEIRFVSPHQILTSNIIFYFYL